VQLDHVTLTGANPVDLTQYTYFVEGVGFVPLPLGPAIEAAALAGDLTQGTLTLVDQVGPVTGNRWTYSFTVVPEPSAATLVLAAAALVARRRRPIGSIPPA
jgi:MYXO-CTERM domain-containing protein